MTVELITGFAGTPHIGSDDVGAFNAGLVGPGDYALTTGNQLKATMSNANTIAVQSGDAVLNGRHVHLTGTTTATVQSGTQGQKRNDIAVLRYSKNTTSGVETCQLVVIKGTPTTGTPADPAHNTGSILDGVATHDMPLYRVSLNGITVGTLVPLFNVLKPMKDMWDSLTQSGTSSLFALLGKVRWWRQDNAVLVSVEAYYYQRFVDAIGVNRIILQEGILPKPIAARSEVQCIASDGNWSRLIVTTIDSAGSLTWTPRSTELAVAANEKIRFQMQYVAA